MTSANRARLRNGALLGLVIGVLGVVAGIVPWVARMEDRAGLPWLFTLRGPVSAPPGISIVTINEGTPAALDLPPEPSDWPRTAFATLVDILHGAGARLIVLDIFFRDGGGGADTGELSRAISRAGNVILTARLSKEQLFFHRPGQGDEAGAVRIGLLSPEDSLERAALGAAPFPLPVVPVQVSQFWAFFPAAGDLPTLPALVAHAAVAADVKAFRRAVEERCPAAAAEPDAIGEPMANGLAAAAALRDARGYLQRLSVECREVLLEDSALATGFGTLLRLHLGPSSYYLNYYGGPRSFPTLPFQNVMQGTKTIAALNGQIVFVGFAARDQVGQEDSFYTVFSDDSGLNLGGVEIAATATANLLAGNALRPVVGLPALVLTLFWGLLLGMACRLLPGVSGVSAGVLLAGGWVLAAQWLLARFDTWLPMLVPVFLQVPLAVLGGLFLQYRQSGAQRERIAAAMGRYVPASLVDKLAEEGLSMSTAAENVNGICMATDAAQYTPLAEALPPDELGEQLNHYFDILFEQVECHGGAVSDILGDAMMAIWVSARPGSGIEQRACQAALRILAELQARAAAGESAALPTRIGLHSGSIRWGTVGARGHIAYRAVGDIVNTAARIEGLNKHLGTWVLASAETLVGTCGLRSRCVGRFLLPGKSVPVTVHELLGTASDRAAAGADLEPELFARALARFQAGDWVGAADLFRGCQQQTPGGDPVAAFYERLCERFIMAPAAASFVNGAVIIESK